MQAMIRGRFCGWWRPQRLRRARRALSRRDAMRIDVLLGNP
jgi:hypothetical protein